MTHGGSTRFAASSSSSSSADGGDDEVLADLREPRPGRWRILEGVPVATVPRLCHLLRARPPTTRPTMRR